MHPRAATAFVSYLQQIRAVVAAQPSWQPVRRSPVGAAIPRSRGRIEPVARNGSIWLVLLDLSADQSFPDFNARRDLYRRCAEAADDLILVVTDAAETRRYWLWHRRRLAQPDQYRESARSAALDGLPQLLRLAVAELRYRGRPADDPAPSIYTALDGRMLRGIRKSPVPDRAHPADASGLQDLIETAPTLTASRMHWRALKQISLVDTDCERGEWLIRGVSALEPLYACCLQRLISWGVDTPGRAASSARIPPDLGALLSMPAQNLAAPSSHFIAHTIVRHNVYGVASSPLQVAAARANVVLELSTGPTRWNGLSDIPEIAHRVVQRLSPGTVDLSRAFLRDALARHSSRLSEALECERVFDILNDLQLPGRGTSEQLARSYADLKQRRLAVAAKLYASVGGDEQSRIPEPLIHFPRLLVRSRSTIIRGQ
ncbi:hypothetical protein BH23GEM6_BH23GEM6_18410 [soil metagenome]